LVIVLNVHAPSEKKSDESKAILRAIRAGFFSRLQSSG